MNYQKITKNDVANGEGIRVTLWVSGCSHHCEDCHNPKTWNPKSGKPFTYDTYKEIREELEKPWIAGLTLSGGDPLHCDNVKTVADIVTYVKSFFPNKTIWCYTGYTLEYLWNNWHSLSVYVQQILYVIDVLVDGQYKKELKDVSYPWAGSSNQRIWTKENGEWVQSKYDKEYRERLNAKSSTRISE